MFLYTKTCWFLGNRIKHMNVYDMRLLFRRCADGRCVWVPADLPCETCLWFGSVGDKALSVETDAAALLELGFRSRSQRKRVLLSSCTKILESLSSATFPELESPPLVPSVTNRPVLDTSPPPRRTAAPASSPFCRHGSWTSGGSSLCWVQVCHHVYPLALLYSWKLLQMSLHY